MKRPVVIVLLTVALLFVLAGIGAVVFFSIRGADFAFNINLVSATAEESKTLNVDTEKPVILSVDDDAGEVSVVGGDVEAVEVRIVKTGNAPTQSRAEEDLKKIKYEIKQNGNSITLLYKLDGIQSNHIDTVDFIVTVPTETVVEIENNLGKVDVADVKGSVNIASDFGDVTVKNIEGALSLENSSGGIEISNVDAGAQDVKVDADFGNIKLEKVNGRDINIKSNSGKLTFINVRATGDLFAKSDFGDVTFENGSAASVTLDTNSGKISITRVNIRGALTITNDFGEIELNQAMAGSYDLKTNSGSVTIDGAKGKLKAHTDFGNINIQNAQSVTLDIKTNSGTIDFSGSLGEGPHSVISDFGGIDLALPADSKLSVDLKTDFGNISSDIPLTVTLDGSSEKNRQVGTMNGGGGQLIVKTNSGGINITAIK
ncbi:MAG: DUF4097 family beta strand repeat protein [Anaerolineales bacterium]|nr:DUF4097 family beta strand repeat protein [Anaerolineales bacterium]